MNKGIGAGSTFEQNPDVTNGDILGSCYSVLRTAYLHPSMGRTDRVEILDLGQLGSVHETSMWTWMHFVTAGFQVDLSRAEAGCTYIQMYIQHGSRGRSACTCLSPTPTELIPDERSTRSRTIVRTCCRCSNRSTLRMSQTQGPGRISAGLAPSGSCIRHRVVRVDDNASLENSFSHSMALNYIQSRSA